MLKILWIQLFSRLESEFISYVFCSTRTLISTQQPITFSLSLSLVFTSVHVLLLLITQITWPSPPWPPLRTRGLLPRARWPGWCGPRCGVTRPGWQSRPDTRCLMVDIYSVSTRYIQDIYSKSTRYLWSLILNIY